MDGDESPPELEEQPELEEDERYPFVYVVFSAQVNYKSAAALLETMGPLAARVDEVHLLLSTPGGSVSVGINLYNILRGMPYRLVTHNTGDIASIGVAIYLAGEERLTCPNTNFLTHGVTQEPPLGQALGAKWLTDTHASILKDEDRINEIVADRTSLTVEELTKTADTEQKYDAQAAVDSGIAHRIAEVEVADDAPVLTAETQQT